VAIPPSARSTCLPAFARPAPPPLFPRAQKQFSTSAGLSGVVGYASAILVKVLAGGALTVLAATFALLKARRVRAFFVAAVGVCACRVLCPRAPRRAARGFSPPAQRGAMHARRSARRADAARGRRTPSLRAVALATTHQMAPSVSHTHAHAAARAR
jgi:hypothetical protein